MVDICIRHDCVIQQVCNPRRGTIATSHYISTSIRSWHRRQTEWTCEGRAGGEGKGGSHWESSINIHTLPRVKQMAIGKLLYTTQGAQLSALWWPGAVGRRGRWEEAQEGGGMCIHTTDSLCRTAETHNIVNQLSSNYKKKKRERELMQSTHFICNCQSTYNERKRCSLLPSITRWISLWDQALMLGMHWG